MKVLSLSLRYLIYFFTSKSKHDIHSPFVYNLVTKVINKRDNKPAFQTIEEIRKKMLKNNKVLNVRDYGAGFGGKKYIKKKISFITRHSSKPVKYARLLYRLVEYFEPASMLELGTSVGISGLYQYSAAPKAVFTTMEGCENTAELARGNFMSAGFNNVNIIVGDFDVNLPNVLSSISTLDYIFIDGNHRKKPVLMYFNECLKKVSKKSIIIIDDINWSDEMQEAWIEVKQNSKVSVTVDLFMMGLVFFDPDLSKQDFTIRF